MPPFDIYFWGEEQAADGLTGIAALGPEPIAFDGDKNTVRSIGKPYLFGLGSLADSKPQGCALTPSRSNFGNKFYGPGAIDFVGQGFMDLRKAPFAPKALQKGETLEGFVSSTAVNEGAIIAAMISYDGFPPLLTSGARYADIFIEKITITSAAAVTPFSGKVTLEAATSDDLWLNTEKKYSILGLIPNIGAATFGGILQVSGLGGDWHGYVPGILMPPLSAATFSPGAMIAAAEPMPFDGASIPSLSMFATSAGAISAGLVIAEH